MRIAQVAGLVLSELSVILAPLMVVCFCFLIIQILLCLLKCVFKSPAGGKLSMRGVCNIIEIYNLLNNCIFCLKGNVLTYCRSGVMGCLVFKPMTNEGYAVKCVEVARVRIGTPMHPRRIR